MSTPKSKRQTSARLNSSKTAGRNRTARVTAPKTEKRKAATKLKAAAKPAVGRHRSSTPQISHPRSKQARIITMLRAPSGATIDAMVQATGWQQHSVRGFLAGVIRKRLGLNLVSAAAESGRIYRITDRTASTVVAAKTSSAG